MAEKRDLERLPASASAALVRAAVERDGGVIIQGLFRDEADGLNAEIDDLVSGYKVGIEGNDFMQEFAGRKTKRITQLVNRSAYFRQHLLDHGRLLEYVDPFMLQASDSYWLSTSQLIELQPGEKAQLLHRDGDNYPAFRQFGAGAPEIAMNCLIALSEYTEEMGATRVIPGSNRWEDWLRPVTQADTIAAVMEKGDCFFFSGKVIHGGGANVSTKPRRALAMAYCPGWLMPEEAYPFQVPIEMARTLSPRAQQLIGFRSFHNQTLEGGSLWQVNYEELGSFLKLDA